MKRQVAAETNKLYSHFALVSIVWICSSCVASTLFGRWAETKKLYSHFALVSFVWICSSCVASTLFGRWADSHFALDGILYIRRWNSSVVL
ncbi:hypothetical protein RRG08_034879 [Elysia crispata]|uniref:Uncharacterized protein n=1 Tax=Elysia crispata TaxID=231223 RepID=A0AAE0ZTK9_9GAST|nr:hypothetical protein RRG08_034879 [Elysia crispata]